MDFSKILDWSSSGHSQSQDNGKQFSNPSPSDDILKQFTDSPQSEGILNNLNLSEDQSKRDYVRQFGYESQCDSLKLFNDKTQSDDSKQDSVKAQIDVFNQIKYQSKRDDQMECADQSQSVNLKKLAGQTQNDNWNQLCDQSQSGNSKLTNPSKDDVVDNHEQPVMNDIQEERTDEMDDCEADVSLTNGDITALAEVVTPKSGTTSKDQNPPEVLNLSWKEEESDAAEQKNVCTEQGSKNSGETTVSNAGVDHCDKCGKRFSSKRLLAKHMYEHKNELLLDKEQSKMYPCFECPWAFSTLLGLEEHSLKIHKKKKPPKKPGSEKLPKNHEQVRFSRLHPSRVMVKSYHCNICKISFKNRNERRLHSIIHASNEEGTPANESQVSCKFCGKEVSQEVQLQVSSNSDLTQNMYACDECLLQCTQLRKRTKGKGGVDDKPFLCETCGNRFHTLSNLERHNKVHTGEKPFACRLCDKSYAYMHALKQHYRMHTQEKPYNCEFCGKAFARRDYLKEHLRVHTKEKPYICKICGRGFSQGGSLRLHQKVHTSRPDDFY